MKYLLSIPVIILGSILEIWYYQHRFSSDGIPDIVSWVSAIGLTIFLSFLVYNAKYYKNTKAVYFLIIVVALYSVAATNAGQSFSLGILSENKAVENSVQAINTDSIEYYIDSIEALNVEFTGNIETLNEMSIRDRAWYPSIVNNLNERQSIIQEQKSEYELILLELRSNSTVHAEVQIESESNIYIFYSNIFTFLSPEFVQLIFQTFFSVIVALMAPLGMIVIRPGKKEEEEIQKVDWEELIDYFVSYGWLNITNKRSNKLVEIDTVLILVEKKNSIMTESQYKQIKKMALKAKVIDKSDILVNNVVEAQMRIKKYFKGE